MPTLTIAYRDDSERLALEQAIAYVAQLRDVAHNAPDGTVLDACEQLALADGRALLRSTLAAALHGRVASAEQKGGAARACPKAHPGRSKGGHPRTILTAVGPLTLERRYFTCAACAQGDFGADRVLGLAGYVTRGACRMACLLGVQQSFVGAERTLTEVAGWDLDDNTIRQLCHATAAQAHAARPDRDTAATFAQAAADAETPVEHELHLDAGKVNTPEGWRDVKVAVFACRARGEPASVATWDERDLPAPAARSIVAAIEEASSFGVRCATEARRLELMDRTTLSVLGDGAEWIWNLAERHFAGAEQLLDFWHGAEHVSAGAKAVYGAGTAAAQAATERGKESLLADGYWGVTEWIGTLAEHVTGTAGAALGGVLNYFGGHQERLNYAVRLRRGQTVGSGLVEGSIKQLLNKRLKQTGARWKAAHVGPFVEFGALAVGPEWQAFWENN